MINRHVWTNIIFIDLMNNSELASRKTTHIRNYEEKWLLKRKLTLFGDMMPQLVVAMKKRLERIS